MKFILGVVGGVIIGVVVAYVSLDFREEKLLYTLTEPAIFGDTSFQNIEIRNDGFDPATNVRIFLSTGLGVESPVVVSKFDMPGDGQAIVGGFERIRRGERVVVSLSSTVRPVSIESIEIKSDRSVASYASVEDWSFDQRSFWIGGAALFVFFGLVGVTLPAYRGYVKGAKKLQS